MRDDTISRQQAIATAVSAAIDWHRLANPQYSIAYIIGEAIRALPSPQQWIPTSERLPKDDTEVIVSCTDDSGDNEFSYVTTGWHYKGLWVVNNDRCYFVKAWQPLPERPWKGEEDG